jgi:hypothetical protein
MNTVAANAIDRSISHTEIVTIDYDSDAASDLSVECDDNVSANGVTEYWGTNDEGNEWRVHMRDQQLPEDAVIVETMPDHHRGSHRAAGNWGTYPHNGAERRIMSRSDAEALLGDDPEYDRIVRDAKPADAKRYEIA